jgi:hypothetical protein
MSGPVGTVRTSRGGQNVQIAEFVASWSDTMADVTGTLKDMTSITTGDVFKACSLPPNVEIVGGDVQIEVQGVGPTAYTLEVGSSTDGTAANFSNQLSGGTTIDLKGAVAARTALTLTSATSFPALMSQVPNDIYIRLIRSVAVATAGKFALRVMYIQRGKVDEAVPS